MKGKTYKFGATVRRWSAGKRAKVVMRKPTNRPGGLEPSKRKDYFTLMSFLNVSVHVHVSTVW